MKRGPNPRLLTMIQCLKGWSMAFSLHKGMVILYACTKTGMAYRGNLYRSSEGKYRHFRWRATDAAHTYYDRPFEHIRQDLNEGKIRLWISK